ncbi:hypothetical protein DAPPUDRAFT_244644 [Daphnia pulex]|uniref:C-type lectin domain-containing protein n=1 Tax=Daphnia pulex TaxID=6669 RepID=E9GLF1_DAPPU|nr:hypothetical protein DAPPUDRAFT_244644 [Daphnia pulex]|eukprot:EFX79503.1 hypothetical protein DAPPUDRAFT_244644 [Daphnia pulex]
MTTWCLALSFLILSLLSSTYGSAIEPRACGGVLYVGDEDVIEAPFQENCKWQIQTDEKHVLAFSLVHGGNFAAAQEFFSIHDGLDVIESENQIHHKVGLTSGESIDTFYTTSSEVEIRFKKTPASPLKLKIQKRGQGNHTTYCSDNNMKLVSIEDNNEENTIYLAWVVNFWTSGTYNKTTGIWTWSSTMANVSPGYTNWAPFEPNNTLVDGNCLTIKNGWYDDPCANLYDAVCESHPEDFIVTTTESYYSTEEGTVTDEPSSISA